MTRSEHIQWAKERAREYLNSGDLVGAVSSMVSDLGKHPETESIAMSPIAMITLTDASIGDLPAVSRFIEGFV